MNLDPFDDTIHATDAELAQPLKPGWWQRLLRWLSGDHR
jgi:hypothetical protein